MFFPLTPGGRWPSNAVEIHKLDSIMFTVYRFHVINACEFPPGHGLNFYGLHYHIFKMVSNDKAPWFSSKVTYLEVSAKISDPFLYLDSQNSISTN